MNDDENELSAYLRRKLSRFPPSHHGSPLVFYPQRHIVQILAGDRTVKKIRYFTDFIKELQVLYRDIGQIIGITDEPDIVIAYFLQSVCADVHDSSVFKYEVDRLFTCLTCAFSETKDDLKALAFSHPALRHITSLVKVTATERTSICNKMAKAMHIVTILVKVRQIVQQNHMVDNKRLTKVISDNEVEVYCISELVIFRLNVDSDRLFLLNYPQILMILDTVLARFMVRLTCEISELHPVDNLPSWSLVSKIYSWGDKLIEAYGGPAYSIIGEFESFVTAVFVTFPESDPIKLGEDFLDSVMINAKETEALYGIPTTHTSDIVLMLKEVMSVNKLSELFGLRKHWGNPMVDASLSGRAIQEKVEEELPISFSSHVKLLASFNRMITLEFIKIHGCWPECVMISKTKSYPLYRAWVRRTTRIPETHPDHDHMHWALLKFRKNCIIDSYEDVLRLITDKSISVYMSHLDATYVRSMMKHITMTEVVEDRRLILEYIRKNHMPIIDIFKIIMTGSTPPEWLANSAAMKGTEMKYLKARVFAVLTYEIRQYFTATEDILKECLFKYNPHQTMTLSESELLDRLGSVTKQLDPSSSAKHLSVIHIVDFSKWNLRMRYENTCLVFKSIDDFLGCPGLIENTHHLFSDMINLIQDPFNPPEEGVLNTESDTIWRFHNCGWEGQRQKGWTMLTSALLSDLSRLTGVHSLICGQGDNQTLLSQFPIPEKFKNAADWVKQDGLAVRRMLDDFYKKLEKECTLIGLKIKTAESCRSLCYFNYSKRLYFCGVELSMMLKRVSKILTEPNESYPTSEFILKTIEGAAFATSIYGHPSILPYLMSRVAVALQLYSSFAENQLTRNLGVLELQKHGLRLNTRWLQILMRVPASLGGPPQLPIAAYMYRGHPDPLCSDLVMLTLKARAGCIISRQIIKVVLSGSWFNQEEGRDLKASLIMSPYSLNLNTPPSARTPLDSEILPALREACHNQSIQDIFSFELDEMSDAIISTLSSLRPFHPIVANDLYTRSLPGRRQTFVSGLSNTTSLGRLVFESTTDPLVRKISSLELDQLKLWINRTIDIATSIAVESEAIIPHWVLAQWCRDESWKCKVVGITVPHPIEQFQLTVSPYDLCAEDCQLSESEHVVFVQHSEDLTELPGVDSTHVTAIRSRSGDPYLGSTISEGVVQRTICCMNPDTTWRDVIRLNTLRKWICAEGSHVDSFLISLIKTRTNIDFSVIEAATGVPSRLSYNHRAALMTAILTCSVSSTTNMHTRIYVSSNRMGEYSHGELNYHMPFGPTFLCFQQLICMVSNLSQSIAWGNSRTIFHAHVRFKPVPTVFDGKMDIPTEMHARMEVTSIPKILFADDQELQFSLIGELPTDDTWENPELATLIDIRIAYANQLIGDSFIKETCIRETVTLKLHHGFSARSTSVSIGDVQLVKPKHFVAALAWNFLLLAPYNIWCTPKRSSAILLSHHFTEGFSTEFWSPYLSAFCSPRIYKELVSDYPELVTFDSTRTTRGVAAVLKDLVSIRMIQIREHLLECSRNLTKVFRFPICAPSFSSLKLLWSKFMELQLSTILTEAEVPFQEVIAFSRDFSANILSSPDDCFFQVLSHIRLDLHLLLQKLKITGFYCVNTKFFDLKEPWIDRLRWAELEQDKPECSVEADIDRPHNYPRLGLSYSYDGTDQAVLLESLHCVCCEVERSTTQHTESYFTLSGILSKSHLRFLDLILQYDLPLNNVIVLGSSTGTEALSFSMFKECNYVYVNCYHPISSFSPHMAGSYIPSAFASSNAIHKLVNPSQAVISSSDLLDLNSIYAIRAHTSGRKFSGLTCDVEVPYDFPLKDILKLVNNVMLLSMKTEGNQWCVIKTPAKCEHEIASIIGIVCQVYQRVVVCRSVYTRPKTNLYYIVAQIQRCVIPESLCPGVVPATLVNDEALRRFVSNCLESEYSPLYCVDALITQSRSWLNSILPKSFGNACNSYIPGFGSTYSTVPSIAIFKSDIMSSLFYLEREIKAHLQLFQRTHQESNLPRSSILGMAKSPFHRTLDSLVSRVNKLELLHSLILQDHFDLSMTVDHIDDWCVMIHEYSMTTRKYRYYLNASRLINHTTRHIYEILGHLYRDSVTGVQVRRLHRNFHRLVFTKTEFLIEDVIAPYQRISVCKKPNSLWRWSRRSEILFWLLSQKIIGGTIGIFSPNCLSVQDMHLAEIFPYLAECSLRRPSVSNVIWLDDLSDLHIVCETRCTVLSLCAPLPLISSILKLPVKLISYHRIPWCGIIPDRVMMIVHVSQPDDLVSDQLMDPTQVQDIYPDVSQFVGGYNELGKSLMGCSCIDCSLEVLLLSDYTCAHSTLDRLCSLKHIETLKDKKHTL